VEGVGGRTNDGRRGVEGEHFFANLQNVEKSFLKHADPVKIKMIKIEE